MVLTLANVLHMPITIFTSVVNMPVICITPTMQVADSAQPLLLTFIQDGPGHYDYAVMGQSTTSSGQQKLTQGNKNHKDVPAVEILALVQRHVSLADVHVPEQKSNVTPFADARTVQIHMVFAPHPQKPEDEHLMTLKGSHFVVILQIYSCRKEENLVYMAISLYWR